MELAVNTIKWARRLVAAAVLTVLCLHAHADLSPEQEASVMEVRNDHKRMGTAFAFDKDYAVTASHVIDNEMVVRVVYYGQQYNAIVVGKYENMDIAVLYIPGLNARHPLKFARTVNTYDRIIIYGYPEYAYFSRAIGKVISPGEPLLYKYNWRMAAVSDAKVRGGYSGGPVVNRKTNRVVGVLTNRDSALFAQNTNGIFTRCDQIRGLW